MPLGGPRSEPRTTSRRTVRRRGPRWWRDEVEDRGRRRSGRPGDGVPGAGTCGPGCADAAATETEPESHGDSGSTRSDQTLRRGRRSGPAARGLRRVADDAASPRTARSRPTRPASARRPATLLELKVSTSERAFRIIAYRLGDYDGGTGHLVHRSRLVRGERQADAVFQPAETRTVVAPWHVSLTADTTGWEPGFYVLRLRTTLGLGAPGPLHRLLALGGRHDRGGGPGDDLAGLQPLGRLQPLRRPERRPAQLGGQLRPALPRRRWA